jgi:predicted DNA-binding transcriptional regulator AlpA
VPHLPQPDQPVNAVLPVGILEIAERLGVKRATVDQWLQRGLLPPPEWTVGGRPAWDWRTIRRWAVESGRMATIADLTLAVGMPAGARETVARFTGAFITPDDYAKTGRLAPRWAGQGMDATFTRAEADELEAEWRRTATSTERIAYLSGDAEDDAIAERYRP